MKTILSLHDKTTEPTQLLHDTVRASLPHHETDAVAGCNCDRWGHPWPGWGHSNVELKVGRPFSLPLDE
jgi:hypothetical protein